MCELNLLFDHHYNKIDKCFQNNFNMLFEYYVNYILDEIKKLISNDTLNNQKMLRKNSKFEDKENDNESNINSSEMNDMHYLYPEDVDIKDEHNNDDIISIGNNFINKKQTEQNKYETDNFINRTKLLKKKNDNIKESKYLDADIININNLETANKLLIINKEENISDKINYLDNIYDNEYFKNDDTDFVKLKNNVNLLINNNSFDCSNKKIYKENNISNDYDDN